MFICLTFNSIVVYYWWYYLFWRLCLWSLLRRYIRELLCSEPWKRLEWQDLFSEQLSQADETESRTRSIISSFSVPLLWISRWNPCVWPGLYLLRETSVRGRTALALWRSVFFIFEGWKSINHKYTSNLWMLSSSNIIHTHAKCVGFMWPLLADLELDTIRTSALGAERYWELSSLQDVCGCLCTVQNIFFIHLLCGMFRSI